MRALVLGYGRSGKAAEALLCRSGFSVTVLDGAAPFPSGDFDVAVVSPGIALTHPWIVEAKRCGVPLKSELQFGCEELKRQGWKLLAVTGSKGKSSVVKLVADAICLSGRHAVPCGNYGVPVCEVAQSSNRPTSQSDNQTTKQSNNSPWAVVEVSSFMMETTELPPDTFEAAAILNLQEDHLDRHGSVEVYHRLKRKLLTMTRHPVDSVAAPPLQQPLFRKSYFDNEILRENGCCAIALMRATGLDDVCIAQAFRDFVPLPHRMNLIAERNGVRFVDDSKATSLAALAAGVKMASSNNQTISQSNNQTTKQPNNQTTKQSNNQTTKQSNNQTILLIAGGLPKGDDPKSVLSTLTERVKKVYLIGQSAEVFFIAWKSAADCEICGTMEQAVEKVLREAESGETVLLSPGTASFDQFRSYGERGDVFAGLVERESKK